MRDDCEEIKQEGYKYYDANFDLIHIRPKVKAFGDKEFYQAILDAQDRYSDRGEALLKEAEECERRSI